MERGEAISMVKKSARSVIQLIDTRYLAAVTGKPTDSLMDIDELQAGSSSSHNDPFSLRRRTR